MSEADAPTRPVPAGDEATNAARPPRLEALARLAPAAVFALAIALAHGEIFASGAERFAPIGPPLEQEVGRGFGVADVTYEAWLVARHARTLLSRPWRVFDTEHCAPDERTLTYGVPLIGLGILAMPAALVSHEPLLVYNCALLAWSALAATAMYLLATGWTGRRAAGIGAALFFAFHPIRLDHILHPAEWDIAWTALALHFADRLFTRGRWRDALGLGLSGAMQVATSFYTLLAASLLAAPIGLWLWLRRAPRRATPAELALSLFCVALAAVLVLGPYAVARDSARIGGRSEFLFASWQGYAPGGPLFPGFALALAALAGLATPRSLALPRAAADPRLPLCAGAALVAFVAAGPWTAISLQHLGLPVPDFDPYAWLSTLPGLDSIRVIARLGTGPHLVACVLAGMGIAAAQNAARGHAGAVGAALVAVIFACVVGVGPRRWSLSELRPPAESIDFFAELAQLGSAGPLLELPLDFVGGASTNLGASRILLESWHGRRTSACFGSFAPPGRDQLQQLALRLPDREAVRALRAQGFTTVVLHHPNGLAAALPQLRPFERARAESEPVLRLLQHGASMSAYELVAAPAGTAP
ncbi:MAG TPA: hypothetical protein VMW19_12915 [Myxococcota bacterium]|nr:hypothetical protein [Myxococcota bacterium]